MSQESRQTSTNMNLTGSIKIYDILKYHINHLIFYEKHTPKSKRVNYAVNLIMSSSAKIRVFFVDILKSVELRSSDNPKLFWYTILLF